MYCYNAMFLLSIIIIINNIINMYFILLNNAL